MTFKFIQSEPSEYYVWENIQSQSQVSTETEDIAELKDMLQTTV